MARSDQGKNRKGCDIGYALATSSCEEANSVDACTVTALDAITAFAVPNPNCSSQSQSVFSGLVALRVTSFSRSLSLLRTGKILFKPTLSAVDECQLKQLLQRCQCLITSHIQISVDANVENRNGSPHLREGKTRSTRDTAFLYITGLSLKPRQVADVDPRASLEVGSIAPRLTL